jgi:hypothetical protein
MNEIINGPSGRSTRYTKRPTAAMLEEEKKN